MDIFTTNQLGEQEIRSLIKAGKGICISIIIPVQQEVDKRDENRIRLKNSLQEVQEILMALDYGSSEIEKILSPAENIVVGGRFLDITSPGLAIYLADGFSRAYQLPYSPKETIAVERQFQIKQMMPLLTVEPYFVLVLGQNSVRLLKATQYTVDRLDLDETPRSLEEALHWDDPERQLQWHSKTASEANGRAAMYHGHGVSTKERHKDDLLRFFQILNDSVSKRLAGEDAPLVLVGVDYLLPIYRETNSYDVLIDKELTGNYEHLGDEEIQRMAWEFVQPYFHDERERVYSRYRELAGKALATVDLTAVLQAAYQGRVDTLLLAMDAHQWGDFEPTTGRVRSHSQPEPGDVELMNLAVINTVLNGGKVYAGLLEKLPGQEQLVALLRF